MEYMFRDLKANEIDVRVNTINEKGVSLLLYKDARVDQDILDETVGAMNWQKHYTRDNANCIIAIYDKDKKQWVEKEDTGTESFSQAEKGLASDSQKRSGFAWGIGRELYTAPFIWVGSDKCKLEDSKRKDKYGNIIYTTKDKFHVEAIEIINKEITGLAIKNQDGVRVFGWKKAR